MACEKFIIPRYTTTREQFEKAGFKCIHLFKNVYFVRNWSTLGRKFSLYGICVLAGERKDND